MLLTSILLVVFLIIFAGICAGIETAVTASAPGKIHNLLTENNIVSARVKKILKIKNKVISTLLVINSILLTVATTIATSISISIYGEELGTLIASIVLSIVIVVVADVLPKTIAVSNAEKITIAASLLIKFLLVALRPINVVLDKITKFVCLMFRINLRDQTVITDEIKGMIEHHTSEASESISAGDDIEMLLGIIDIKKTSISKIMIHKSAIKSINRYAPTHDIIDKAIRSRHSYMPLWKGNPENIISTLNVNRLVKDIAMNKDLIKDIDHYTSEPYFISENITIFEQLVEFKDNQKNIALIIDEYGKLEGFVTLQDIVDEIIGEVKENNIRGHQQIIENSPTEFLVKGNSLVRDINKQLKMQLKSTTANTIGGYVTTKLGRLPQISDEIRINNCKINVLEVSNNIITLLQISMHKKKT